MNDSSELSYAQELVAAIIGERLAHESNDALRNAFREYNGFANAFAYGAQPFVTCFCEEDDLLSQWRGYSPGQVGVSIGVSLTGQLPTQTYVRQVLYDEGHQIASVAQVVDSWLDTTKSLTGDGAYDVKEVVPYPALWSLQEALAEHHLCFKHPGFSEEREWRLIRLVDVQEAVRVSWNAKYQEKHRAIYEIAEEHGVSPPGLSATLTPADHLDVHFRRSSIGLVPYVELRLRKWGPMYDELPIEQVVQGPTENPELSLESLKGYLQSEGYGGFDSVRRSEVPFRERR